MLNYPRMLSPSAAQPPQHPSSRCSSKSDPYKVRGGSPRCDVAHDVPGVEAAPLRLPHCLTCAARRPPLAVRDRWSPTLMTLLCLSIRFWCLVELAVEGAVEVAGEVGLDAASDVAFGFAFGQAALDVGLGGRVAAHPVDGDDVQGPVELAVAEAVEPVPVGAAGGDGHGRGAGQHREGGFAADPACVGP